MTAAEFNKRSAAMLRAFEKEVRAMGADEARLRFRTEHRLVYVKRHTVEAYFRRYQRRVRPRLPEQGKGAA